MVVNGFHTEYVINVSYYVDHSGLLTLYCPLPDGRLSRGSFSKCCAVCWCTLGALWPLHSSHSTYYSYQIIFMSWLMIILGLGRANIRLLRYFCNLLGYTYLAALSPELHKPRWKSCIIVGTSCYELMVLLGKWGTFPLKICGKKLRHFLPVGIFSNIKFCLH